MYVGNCTDEDATYQIDNGGGGVAWPTCGKKKYKVDNKLEYQSKVTYAIGNERPTIDLVDLNHKPTDEILVLLHKADGLYFITSLVLE